MYRKQGSTSALSGVTSGPYTGDTRLIDAERLAPATRMKIARALRSIGEPSPIAVMRPGSFFSKATVAKILILVCMAVFVLLWSIGYEDSASSWVRQPLYASPLYLVVGALWLSSIFIAIRERFSSGPDSLPAGKYLFSLDIVEVGMPDETGRQQLRVRPLGNARDAKIEGDPPSGKRAELVIHFADLTTERFVLPRNDRNGDRVMRGLEHAQNLLEELTYKPELERAFIFDLFFDLRADRSWASVAPDGAPMSKRSAAVKEETEAAEGEGAKAKKKIASKVAKIVHHRVTPFVFAGLGVVMGLSIFEMRRLSGDHFLLMGAWYSQTPEAFDQYVANGGLRPEVAQRYKENIIRARAVEEEERKKEAAKKEENTKKAAHVKTAVECIEALRTKRSPSHENSARIVENIIYKAERTRERNIPVVFVRKIDKTPVTPADLPTEEALRGELEEREKVMVDAFSKIFGETCPPTIIKWEWVAKELESFRPPQESGGMSITYSVSWSETGLEVSPGFKIRPLIFDFTNVELRAPADSPGTGAWAVESFKLFVEPPSNFVMAMRPRSLFVLTGEKPTAFDRRIYSVLTARAFDRVYDEIYTLFFAGNPRVPLRPDE